MNQRDVNDVLLRNVAKLSKLSEREEEMMPPSGAPMPSVDEIRKIVSLVKAIVFTDYFYKRQSNPEVRSYYVGYSMEELFNLLRRQTTRGLQFCTNCPDDESADITEQSTRLALDFIEQLPEVKRMLYTDVEAVFQNDPAAVNYGEVIYCYPVVNAMTHYRTAHVLHTMGVPVIPRIITEMAHSRTGIDIHPGATIGEYFAIDHGTGVVIGETCIIGNHVTLYQGVTLGAKSFKYDADGNMLNVPRHPILEDHVTVYSNASILGRITVGHHSVVGGNIWVTHDLPPYSRLQQSRPQDLGFQGGLGI